MVVEEFKAKHSLQHLLKATGLPKSVYYYHRTTCKQPCASNDLLVKIRDIYHAHKGRYGYRRITSALRAMGVLVNHKRVQRLMNELGLKSKVRPKRYKSYKGEVGKIAENTLNREFTAQKPNQKWVTDVTEFKVDNEKVYLSPMIDLFNQEVISYEVRKSVALPLVTDMLKTATARLKPNEKPVVHSDQGWQYQNKQYQNHLKEKGLQQSMSRKGNCLDNAVAENFFGILKSEMYHNETFKDVNDLIENIKEYIHYYNNERIKLKLKGLSPIQYRNQALAAA
ncbi:IS3 family transposase [Pseudoalteromonas sp. KJ71-7]|uniref:IS3 family transposase n=1 Tax=unclassified Pseudoalteromonas TaxID=194690 RepID=UPI0039B0951A|nr:IS3 family transposase [Ningiella sp. W23]